MLIISMEKQDEFLRTERELEKIKKFCKICKKRKVITDIKNDPRSIEIKLSCGHKNKIKLPNYLNEKQR